MSKIGLLTAASAFALLVLTLSASTAEAQTLKWYPSGKIEVRNLVLVGYEGKPLGKHSGRLLGFRGTLAPTLRGNLELKTLTVNPARRTGVIALRAQGSGSILGGIQGWGQKLNVLGSVSLSGGLKAALTGCKIWVKPVGPQLLGPIISIKR